MAKAPQDLQIAILGAGMGGLTCALALAKRGFKNIDVYENAHDLGFVGAGIQLAPNMARVLDTLGVWKGIEAEAVNIIDTSVRGMYNSQNLGLCLYQSPKEAIASTGANRISFNRGRQQHRACQRGPPLY